MAFVMVCYIAIYDRGKYVSGFYFPVRFNPDNENQFCFCLYLEHLLIVF
ncbi:hypothetical protein UYSO10_3923 [Kosakonia radicincitans]|nr:hypothetical protein UYSO10_3923 [Kosakonia radicincitans]